MSTVVVPVDARAVADVALAVSHVSALGGGGAGAATYVHGERIRGVRVNGDDVTVHLVVDRDATSLPDVARAVREAIRSQVAQTGRVDVVIEDITDEDPADEPDVAASPAPPRRQVAEVFPDDGGSPLSADLLEPGDGLLALGSEERP